MGLLGEVQAEQEASRVGGVCGIRRVLETLPPAEAAELREILAEPNTKYMHSTIVRVLKARGFEIGREAVSNHRRGICRCR